MQLVVLRSLFYHVVCCSVVILAVGTFGVSTAVASSTPKMVVKGQYLVKLNSVRASSNSTAKAFSSRGLTIKQNLGAVSLAVPALRALSSSASADITPEDPSDTTCQDLMAAGEAEYCEPDYVVTASSTAALSTPQDPQFNSLWGLSTNSGIDCPNAWDYSTGSSSIVVAVIDTGVDYNHPDLAQNVWTNADEIPGNGVDDDGNGYIDDVHGINAATHTGNPMDDNGHGTHVSGTIGAAGNNSIGVSGINWNVKIMGLKFLGATGSGSISGAIEAIRYMVAMKKRGTNIRVVNNSWGGSGYSKALEDAISSANAEGIVFVAAAGNEAADNDSVESYPANYSLPNVISVAAVDKEHNLASFSNYGVKLVGVAAPGVGIISTVPGGKYSSLSGTSMATPHVTGAMALLFGYAPSLGVQEAVQRLYETAVPVESLTGVIRTGRLINAYRLLANIRKPMSGNGGGADTCQYQVSVSDARKDVGADDGTLLLNHVDEFEYRSVALPFSFPLDGKNYSYVTVSPNGILYFGKVTPEDLDYENGTRAPLNSLAVMHTDLLSTVRMSSEADSLTLYWRSQLASAGAPQGEIIARVRLSASGSIEEWLSTSSEAVASALRKSVTVGVTGSSAAHSVTYAYNASGSPITLDTGISYNTQCANSGESTVAIQKVQLWGIRANAKGNQLSRTLSPGGKFKSRVTASSSGLQKSAVIRIALDKKKCSRRVPLTVDAGKTFLSGRIPRSAANYFKRMTIAVDSTSATGPIAQTRSAKTKSISASTFAGLCVSIAKSITKE